MKRTLSFVICIIILMSFTLPIYAEATIDDGITVMRYQNIVSASSSLTISGNTATAKGSVVATTSSASVYVRVTLQKNVSGVWQNVPDASWSNSVTGKNLSVSGNKTISSGSYRVETYYIVTANGITESGTVYSATKTY